MTKRHLGYSITKKASIVCLTILVTACSNKVSFFGTGMTPGAPAPYGVGSEQTRTSAQNSGTILENERVKIQGRGGSKVYFGSKDGFLTALKAKASSARPAETLVEGTRDTLSFMSIQKDRALDETYHLIETGWYKGKYKATAIVNKKNLHASSLDLKIVDRQGRLAPSETIQSVEDAIFRRTKQLNQ